MTVYDQMENYWELTEKMGQIVETIFLNMTMCLLTVEKNISNMNEYFVNLPAYLELTERQLTFVEKRF